MLPPEHLRTGAARMKEDKLMIIIIYHDFLPIPRRGSHVKSDKTHKLKRVKMERSEVGIKYRSPKAYRQQLGPGRPTWSRYSPKQRMNCLTNLTLHL